MAIHRRFAQPERPLRQVQRIFPVVEYPLYVAVTTHNHTVLHKIIRTRATGDRNIEVAFCQQLLIGRHKTVQQFQGNRDGAAVLQIVIVDFRQGIDGCAVQNQFVHAVLFRQNDLFHRLRNVQFFLLKGDAQQLRLLFVKQYAVLRGITGVLRRNGVALLHHQIVVIRRHIDHGGWQLQPVCLD